MSARPSAQALNPRLASALNAAPPAPTAVPMSALSSLAGAAGGVEVPQHARRAEINRRGDMLQSCCGGRSRSAWHDARLLDRGGAVAGCCK